MDKRKWIIAVIVAAALILAVGVVGYRMYKENAAENQRIQNIVPEQKKDTVAWGEVKYDKVYDISVDFQAAVADINVKEGQHVSLGDMLVTLDITEYEGNLHKLRQQLFANEAGVAQTQKDIGTKTRELESGSKAELRLLQNSLARAKQEVETAKKDAEKYKALYEAGAVSKQALEQYTDLLNLKEKVQSDVEDNMEKTRRSLQEELDQLNLALKSKQAQSEQIKADLAILENRNVKPYFKGNQIISCVKNGIVQNISVNTAAKLGIQNAPTKVLQLIDGDSLMISAEIQEEFIGDISSGQEVKIVPAANKNLSIPGVITQIHNKAVEKDGKRIVKVDVKPNNPDEFLKPGYSVDVYFPAK